MRDETGEGRVGLGEYQVGGLRFPGISLNEQQRTAQFPDEDREQQQRRSGPTAENLVRDLGAAGAASTG